jgi:hypothetical protein
MKKGDKIYLRTKEATICLKVVNVIKRPTKKVRHARP